MWLKLNFEGIDFYLRISRYKTGSGDALDDWCDVDITLQSDKWLNCTRSGELLLSDEVDDILEHFEKLLKNGIRQTTELTFIESDFEFTLHPKFVFPKDGTELSDVTADFRLYFWNGILTHNFLSLEMERDNIEAFVTYLKLVTKKTDKADISVQKLLNKGILLKY